jgi:hypothetical protein
MELNKQLESERADNRDKLKKLQDAYEIIEEQLNVEKKRAETASQSAASNTGSVGHAKLLADYEDLKKRYEEMTEKIHIPGHWFILDFSNPESIHNYSNTAIAHCKNTAAFLRNLIPEKNRDVVKAKIINILGISDIVAKNLKLSPYLICAAIAQEVFKMFERESFDAISSSQYDRSHVKRTEYYSVYANNKEVLSKTLWEQNKTFKKWGIEKIDAIASICGIEKDAVERVALDALKRVWLLQRLFHACVVTPVVVFAACGDPYDVDIVCDKDVSENRDPDSDGETTEKGKARRYRVSYTIFPGFYIDNRMAVHCAVEVHSIKGLVFNN